MQKITFNTNQCAVAGWNEEGGSYQLFYLFVSDKIQ